MQLKKPKNIRASLTKATCLLLGAPVVSLQASEFSVKKWDFESAILYYSEDQRVTAIEPVINAKKSLKDDASFSVKLVADVLSGASANGAVPTPQPQTFASPSGLSSYSVNANETPLDSTFHDTRFAANLTWETPVSRLVKRTTGMNFSAETDYLSLGLSTNYSFDLNKKNTTFSTGIAVNSDRIAPVGGKPDPLTEVPTQATGGGGGENEDEGEGGEGGLEAFFEGEPKLSADLLLGVTQILSRKTLTQLNYSYGKTSGYLTDPYKLVSVIDPSTGVPVANSTNDYLYYYEKRPDSRIRQSVYWKLNHQLTNDVIYLSYRYFWDDWNVKSHTVDLRYRFEIGKHSYLQPHYRYYQQSAADFYRYFITSTETVPEYVSADYRLGKFKSNTVGILYGLELSKTAEFNFRVEYFRQTGEGHPDVAVGALTGYDLFPDINAVIMQINYSQKF